MWIQEMSGVMVVELVNLCDIVLLCDEFQKYLKVCQDIIFKEEMIFFVVDRGIVFCDKFVEEERIVVMEYLVCVKDEWRNL